VIGRTFYSVLNQGGDHDDEQAMSYSMVVCFFDNSTIRPKGGML
jgi:hypothetical protein